MAKDVLNKSKLSEEEDRIMVKVLSCECHKPSKIYKILNWANSRVSDRWKVAIVLSATSDTLSFLFSPWKSASTELLVFVGVTVLAYVGIYVLFSDFQIKEIVSNIRKLL